MDGTLKDLLAVLELRPTESGFRAESMDPGHGVVFGGQLLAQSLLAATRSVPCKVVLTQHTVFSRAATPDTPLSIVVDVVHAGRSFASATVTLAQRERVCARSSVLLHDPAPDLLRHADPPPEVTAPDDLPPSPSELWDVRIVDGVDLSDPAAVGPPQLRLWARFPGAPDDLTTSQALLAYLSDGFLIGTAMRPHAGIGQSMAHQSVNTTVLSQTLTFHEPFAAGEWLLLDQRSTHAGRGLSRGRAEVFTADGRLVASFAQDNMIRAM